MNLNVLPTFPCYDSFSIGTHSGMHHCDETVGAAIIADLGRYMQCDSISIIRTRDEKKLRKCNVWIDCGGGPFDHHKPGFDKKRKSGTTYASSGLVWEQFGKLLIIEIMKNMGLIDSLIEDVETIFDDIDRWYIEPIDAEDNGEVIERKNIMFNTIELYRPSYLEVLEGTPNYDDAFEHALLSAVDIIDNLIRKRISELSAEKLIDECIEDLSNHILTLPSGLIPWVDYVCYLNEVKHKRVYFVKSRHSTGEWAVQCVPPSVEEKNEQIVPFPKTWKGLTDTLPEVSGVETATFCHNNLFFARAKTEKDAEELCIKAMMMANIM